MDVGIEMLSVIGINRMDSCLLEQGSSKKALFEVTGGGKDCRGPCTAFSPRI